MRLFDRIIFRAIDRYHDTRDGAADYMAPHSPVRALNDPMLHVFRVDNGFLVRSYTGDLVFCPMLSDVSTAATQLLAKAQLRLEAKTTSHANSPLRSI